MSGQPFFCLSRDTRVPDRFVSIWGMKKKIFPESGRFAGNWETLYFFLGNMKYFWDSAGRKVGIFTRMSPKKTGGSSKFPVGQSKSRIVLLKQRLLESPPLLMKIVSSGGAGGVGWDGGFEIVLNCLVQLYGKPNVSVK